jgi:hypothetical protein
MRVERALEILKQGRRIGLKSARSERHRTISRQ